MLPGRRHMSLTHFSILKLDYRFLEDVARTADQVSRDTFLKKPKRKKYVSISIDLLKFKFLAISLFVNLSAVSRGHCYLGLSW